MVTLIFVTTLLHMQETRRDVFQAIADPTRRAIINLVSKKSLNVNAVADHFEISRPAVSKHLRILTECGVILIEDQGRERLCRINLNKLKEVDRWLDHYRKFWNHKLDALGNFLERPEKPGKDELPRKQATTVKAEDQQMRGKAAKETQPARQKITTKVKKNNKTGNHQ
ncbi:ArsR/SmtB family transcription factor [Flavitalea antarctica]